MKKNPHAVALGRLGGRARAESLTPEKRQEISRKAGKARAAQSVAKTSKAGGRARAQSLTPEQRSVIARKAAAARWAKKAKDAPPK